MYTLYFLPGACSLAINVVLHVLEQAVELIDKQQVENFSAINPAATVPVLIEGDNTLREGAAIMLHLLDKHQSHMMPKSSCGRKRAIRDIMFANASMHPAYGRLFFIAQNIDDEKTKQAAFKVAAEATTTLWQVVEQQLTEQDFLGGDKPSAADIMLAVYSRWGANFPVEIQIGPNTRKMLEGVLEMTNFQDALAAEEAQSAV
ncbi:glutathione S-transferase family protein [Shewanella sp. VB17]|uniref:glutathione S-transferase family protein n=1 Tax=Shewanella sp. VB17 TaxID=2739432 RepID=UPI0015666A7D|nr:glutathione S-transferase family protein [Shewanella sp. VB17]NRD72729.1 glutathione S-transferase family protein [Shewanella sp. VB17]